MGPLYPGTPFNVGFNDVFGTPSDGTSGAPLDAGTATWTLTTLSGTVLATGTMTYIAESEGNYIGVISATDTMLAAGLSDVVLLFGFTQGSFTSTWYESLRVAKRQ